MKLAITLAAATLILCSCAVSLGPDGSLQISADPVTTQRIADSIIDEINEELRRGGK